MRKTVNMLSLFLAICLLWTCAANASDPSFINIAPEATLTGSGSFANLVNEVVDPVDPNLYLTDYSTGAAHGGVTFQWGRKVVIDQILVYKQLGGTTSGYTAPYAIRVWLVESDGTFVENLYGSYPYGINESPILTLTTIDLAPVIVDTNQKISIYWWSPSGAWTKLDEIVIRGNEQLNDPQFCGDEDTFYLTGDVNADCYVDMVDFAIICSKWLNCTDHTDPRCAPFLQ